jgi:TrmH RNA methyltransferase
MPLPATRPPAPPRAVNVCGFAAVAAAFGRRPKCVQRLFFDAERGRRAGDFCSWMAQERRIYRQVEPAELERIAGTIHHGGIVAVTERPALRAPKFRELVDWQQAGEPVLLLDRVGNPHNLGAIARTAAFFGWSKMILPRHPQQAQPNDAAYRIAEGGLEHVQVFEVGPLVAFFKLLRNHFLIVGATANGGKRLDLARPPRAPGRPVALVLGNEETGLDPRVAGGCELLVHIGGVGAVESLNVSAAAAILIHWATGKRERRPAGEKLAAAIAVAEGEGMPVAGGPPKTK